MERSHHTFFIASEEPKTADSGGKSKFGCPGLLIMALDQQGAALASPVIACVKPKWKERRPALPGLQFAFESNKVLVNQPSIRVSARQPEVA
jgi:hypothetical protein